MSEKLGNNIKGIKDKNRALILKLIATNKNISRVDISRLTGLSKMGISNIVSELIRENMIEEKESYTNGGTVSEENGYIFGRPPIMLSISEKSPCICGMLIKRGLCEVIISDISGKIYDKVVYKYENEITEKELYDILINAFFQIKNKTNKDIIAIGISSIGPVNSKVGIILNPPFFYNIENVEITKMMEEGTSIPTFLINDANAAALAEKLYGIGNNYNNFVYLHMMNGIGAGFILEGQLYGGEIGQSGEIGHTSINFSGPKCICGNTGCLELYANIERMNENISELRHIYSSSILNEDRKFTWIEIIDAANSNDYFAIHILDDFCKYISYALVDVLNILDISCIITGYDSNIDGDILEKMLIRHVSSSILYSKYRNIDIIRSKFLGDAPLIGAVAFIADLIFNLNIKI